LCYYNINNTRKEIAMQITDERKKALQPIFVAATAYVKALPMDDHYKKKILEYSQDLWAYLKHFGLVENDDNYWKEVINGANHLYEKYKEDDEQGVIKHMTLTVVDLLSAEHHCKINK
jgi:hypothetical protein